MDEQSCNGFCIRDDDKLAIGMYVDHNDDGGCHVPTLAHESLHAAMFTGHMVGLEPTLTSHEEIAYLVGWFVGTVFDFIDKDCKGLR